MIISKKLLATVFNWPTDLPIEAPLISCTFMPRLLPHFMSANVYIPALLSTAETNCLML